MGVNINILSIQSAVAYGHVGNSAAVFPLQRLGAEIWPVATVQFSNHPGYGEYTGSVTAPDTIRALVDGIEARGVLPDCAALLTGYVGDPGTGGAILYAAARLRASRADALWCCDPVIGDDGRIYVRAGIDAFFREQAVPGADLLTPNQFELSVLTGLACRTLDQTKAAACALLARMRAGSPRAVLVTSLMLEDTPANALDMLVATSQGCCRLRVPRLALSPNGAGDLIAALFLFHTLHTGSPRLAMEAAASAVHGVLTRTLAAGSRELLLVAAQDQFVTPDRQFASESC